MENVVNELLTKVVGINDFLPHVEGAESKVVRVGLGNFLASKVEDLSVDVDFELGVLGSSTFDHQQTLGALRSQAGVVV